MSTTIVGEISPPKDWHLAEIKNQSALVQAADFLLSPGRYLFGGRTVEIIGDKVHHVASFHPLGNKNRCSTNPNLHSSEMSMLRTALAILCLVPGYIIGIPLKAFCRDFVNSYGEAWKKIYIDLSKRMVSECFEKFRKNLERLKAEISNALGAPLSSEGRSYELTDRDWFWKSLILNIRSIGSVEQPIINQISLQTELGKLRVEEPVDTLVIYSNKKWDISAASKIFE